MGRWRLVQGHTNVSRYIIRGISNCFLPDLGACLANLELPPKLLSSVRMSEGNIIRRLESFKWLFRLSHPISNLDGSGKTFVDME